MAAPRTRQQRALDELLNSDDEDDSGLNRSLVNQTKVNPVRQEYTTHRSVAEAASRRKEDTTAPCRMTERQTREIPSKVLSAQTILNPATSKDATVHFGMDVTDDLGAMLEEFSRLRRLGDYRSAAQYFDENLRDFADILPVTIEYADMLVEQSAYEALTEFLRPYHDTLSRHLSADVRLTDQERSMWLYKANLHLIHAFAQMHRNGDIELPEVTVRNIERHMRPLSKRAQVAPSLESAEVQLFRYALMIISRVEKETNLTPEADFDHWANCDHLYRPLLACGLVWDTRDLICALIECEGANSAWKIIYQTGIHSPSAFNSLLTDWNMGQYDESTYLAILDILVHVSNSLSSHTFKQPTKEDLRTAERCLEHARSVATCLKESNSELVHSRSYLAWVLAETQLRRKRNPGDSDLTSHLNAYPGLTVHTNTLPVYLPMKCENPTCYLSPYSRNVVRTSGDDLLEVAVETARSHEDYATEVECLAELIYRSTGGLQGQQQRLSRMYHLQRHEQKDILNAQLTCLTRFLATSTDQDRQALLADIWDIRHVSRESKHAAASLTGWCLHVIEKALHPDPSGAAAPSPLDVDPSLVNLPMYIKDHLRNRGIEEGYGLDMNLVDSFHRRARVRCATSRRRSRDASPQCRTNSAVTRRTESYERARPLDDAKDIIIGNLPRLSRVTRATANRALPAITLENAAHDSCPQTDVEDPDPPFKLVPATDNVPEDPPHGCQPKLEDPESPRTGLARRSTVEVTDGSESEGSRA